MIRIIVRTADRGAAANVGGPVDISFKTFEADLPELEKHLRKNNCTYVASEVVGVELIDLSTPVPMQPIQPPPLSIEG